MQLFKDVIVAVGGIVEASLFDQIADSRKKAGLAMDRTDFTALLGGAYHEYKIIDKDLWHFCHELRKTRNLLHLKAADFQEHTAYTIDEANECLKKLEEFRKHLKNER